MASNAPRFSTSKPPILGAAGDHHRAGADALAIEQLQNQGFAQIVCGLEADHLGRNGGLDPELMCLAVGARHQGHAGDPGRKAEVVLDPGRGPGLAAERTTVEHQDGKPFRRCIQPPSAVAGLVGSSPHR